jgi:beta-galactosidase
LSRRGPLTYVFNYGVTPYRIEEATRFVAGQQNVPPQGVSIYRAQ